ncbi:BRCT domain-containing protein [Flavobacterium beibuense]|uniref:BRCT domain-containing protein n=1 Tax=Flavobacterium beibuense TaxID=657326 RepID=UPI003A91E029
MNLEELLQNEDILSFNTREVGGQHMHYLSLKRLAMIAELSEEEFEALYEKVEYKAKRYTMVRALNASTFFDQPYKEITVTGAYLFFKFASDYAKYRHFAEYATYFKELAFEDLIKYFAKNEFKSKKKKSTVPEEFRPKTDDEWLNLEAKKVDKDLRVPDLENVENKDHIFYGKSIVITGNFSNWPIREDLVKVITKHGGHIKTSINKKTDYVVIGTEAGPSKLKKIEELGVASMNEEEFLTHIQNQN